ncbi:MAG: plastocyanin/azurin family copper-binding protein [Gemmatimonadota bacterium]
MKSIALPVGLLVLAAGLGGCGSGTGGTTGPVAAQLVITAQPDTAFLGTPFSPIFTVHVQDASGHLVTSSNANVRVYIRAVGPGPLGGSAAHLAVGGQVTFPDLKIDSLGGYRIIAKSGSLDSAVSATITVVPVPPPPAALEVTLNTLVSGPQYRSTRNGSVNPAFDTLAVHGTVTWSWTTGLHGVHSTGSPTFTDSDTSSVVGHEYAMTFDAAGSYFYNCTIHGAAMSGKIVVK